MKTLPGVVRADGWNSAMMGVGTKRDKMRSLKFFTEYLPYEQLLELWDGDDMAARIVEIWPDEMLRRGWILSSADDKDGMEAVQTHLDTLDLRGELRRALCYARAYGGGGILLGAVDGQTDLSQPLIPERVTSLDWLTVFDANELRPSHYYANPTAPKYAKPSHYYLAPTSVGMEFTEGQDRKAKLATFGRAQSTPIHESRFLIFDGIRVTNRYRYNNGWGHSVLNRVWSVLSGFNMSWSAAWHLVSEFSQGVYKIKGLAEMLKKDNGKWIQQRLTAIDMTKSVVRAMMIDADLEEFERLTTPITGLSDVLDKGNLRLAAAAGIPLTILLGESPGGLGSNGSGETRAWYDRVSSAQPREVAPSITRVVDLLANLYGVEPGYKVTFPSLWEPTELECAQARNVQMLTDTGYINANVLYSDEVAKSRFASAKYSYETVVDFEERAKLASVDVTSKNVLNGAQVQSLVDVIVQYNAKQLSEENALGVLQLSFQLTEQEAKDVLGKSVFVPETLTQPALPPPPPPPAQEMQVLGDPPGRIRKKPPTPFEEGEP